MHTHTHKHAHTHTNARTHTHARKHTHTQTHAHTHTQVGQGLDSVFMGCVTVATVFLSVVKTPSVYKTAM